MKLQTFFGSLGLETVLRPRVGRQINATATTQRAYLALKGRGFGQTLLGCLVYRLIALDYFVLCIKNSTQT